MPGKVKEKQCTHIHVVNLLNHLFYYSGRIYGVRLHYYLKQVSSSSEFIFSSLRMSSKMIDEF